MINLKKITSSLCFFVFTISFLFSQSGFPHPRGLITKDEVQTIRQKVTHEPYISMMHFMRKSAERMVAENNKTAYDSSAVASIYADLYILSSDNKDAETAWSYASGLMEKSEFLNNPVSRGLTRARLLRDLAEIYDFCYDAWPPERLKAISEKLIYNIMTTSSNMGYDANYSIESNWMGVRYGAVLFASLVCDDFEANDKTRSRLLPFEWNATKCLGDHMRANINTNGWNTESLSYFAYNWTFIGSALVAYRNNFGSRIGQLLEPRAINSLWGYATASVSITGKNGKVMQPDFSDDDPMSSYYLFPLGLRVFPETQKPELLWMLNYLSGPDTWPNDGDQLFYNIIWTPENIVAENPVKAGWLTYYDPDQGIALFRNRFLDCNDILAAFTATAKRVRGHQGFDNLGFRIIGLGSIWTVGAGRTGQVAGQSTLFPDIDIPTHKGTGGALGKVLNTSFEKDGSGSVTGAGSCMGVTNHVRTFRADYSGISGAPAVFIISDVSDNGKIWRMNSPEFNNLKVLKDGFLLTSPDGAELKALVFSNADNLTITSDKVHYGGSTVQQNSGIAYNGKSYAWTNAIDCNTNGRICVIMTLIPKGALHPQVSLTDNGHITVGNKIYPESFTKNPDKKIKYEKLKKI